MKNPLLAPEIKEMIEQGDANALREFCESGPPGLIAEFLSALPPTEAWTALEFVDPALRAQIFSYLDEDVQAEITDRLSRKELAALVSVMPADDRVDLLKRIPERQRELVLPALAQAEREDIRKLSAYPEGTAGAVMTSDYATLSPELTATEAIERLRREAPSAETIDQSYVVDENRRLLGMVSLRDLILARPRDRVADIMQTEVASIHAGDDQEQAAAKIQRYDLVALPVLDEQDRLVGIITHDDALDIVTQENTEDIEKLMAIGGAHEAGAYLRTRAWSHFRKRAPWIVVLAALGLISGYIVHTYESLLVQFAVLATFMPMLADTGGNTGSQAATVVIRALALGEVSPRHVLPVAFKELAIALMLGCLLGILAFGRALLFGGTMGGVPPVWQLGAAVGAALALQVVTATLIGALLPIGAARLGMDPAVVATPALTTVVDISGLLLYFLVVRLILGV